MINVGFHCQNTQAKVGHKSIVIGNDDGDQVVIFYPVSFERNVDGYRFLFHLFLNAARLAAEEMAKDGDDDE